MSVAVQTFQDLQLAEPIQRAITDLKYVTPTPIQAQSIPSVIAGRDLIGCAQTGTGKTAAFVLPILQQMVTTPKQINRKSARVLILTPTRELAGQIHDCIQGLGRHMRCRTALVYGGVPQGAQVRAISGGVDILVATPGRLLDLIEQRHINLADVGTLVLDEADRMLDMGFLPPIRQISKMLQKNRQTILFSATMAGTILQLTKEILVDPVHVTVAPPATVIEAIDERVLFVDDTNKRPLLVSLLKGKDVERTLVFAGTKRGAERLVQHLDKSGIIACAIHGDKSQNQRNNALRDFRTGRCRVLIATDVAARGIDVTGISHVINYDLPNDPSNYVHRIGRTARAGTSGIAMSFCGSDERVYLRDIERLLKRPVTVWTDHPYHAPHVQAGPTSARPAPKKFGGRKPFSHPHGQRKGGFRSSGRTDRRAA